MEKLIHSSSIEGFVKEYVSAGFGTMNKNDFEVFIFTKLLTMQKIDCDVSSDYSLSRYLKIPESKVKRLRYEANLKYGSSLGTEKEMFLRYALTAKYEIDESTTKRVKMYIPDIAFRKFLMAELLKQNKFADSSFNTNIVVLDKRDYFILFTSIGLSKDESRKLKNDLTKKRVQNIDIEEVFLDVASSVAKDVMGSEASKIVEFGVAKIFEKIKNLK